MWAESVLQLCFVNQVHVLRTLIAIGDTGMGDAFACVMIRLRTRSVGRKVESTVTARFGGNICGLQVRFGKGS